IPIHRCIANAAVGTSQRLKSGPATVFSRSKKPGVEREVSPPYRRSSAIPSINKHFCFCHFVIGYHEITPSLRLIYATPCLYIVLINAKSLDRRFDSLGSKKSTSQTYYECLCLSAARRIHVLA